MDLDRDRLPDTTTELLRLADTAYLETRSLRVHAIAAAGLEKAALITPNSYDVLWRQARCYLVIGDNLEQASLKQRFYRGAVSFGEEATRLSPSQPEGYAELAAARGLLASTRLAPPKSEQKAIEMPARHLVTHHPHYQSGAGHRVLGGLYTLSPAWPAGVGDLEEAIDLLESAVEFTPPHPLNHYFLAQAYGKSGRKVDAIKQYNAVLKAKATGQWRLTGRPYRRKAAQRIRDLSNQGSPAQ